MASHTEMSQDYDTCLADFAAGDLYGAGTAFAWLAIAAAPKQTAVEETVDCQLNTVEVADFLAGFIYGFTGHNWQTYFDTCFKDTPAFETDVCTAVNDFATKEN